MEDITTLLTDFMASPSGVVIKGLFVGTLVVFLLGLLAAIKDKTFSWVYFDSFVRSTLMGRVVPVFIVLAVGYITNESTLTGAGIAVGGAVAVGMIASAAESIRQMALPPAESAERNVTPQA
jgi:hypothetical protein